MAPAITGLGGGSTLVVAAALAVFRAWAYFAASSAFLSATAFTSAALLVAAVVSLGECFAFVAIYLHFSPPVLWHLYPSVVYHYISILQRCTALGNRKLNLANETLQR